MSILIEERPDPPNRADRIRDIVLAAALAAALCLVGWKWQHAAKRLQDRHAAAAAASRQRAQPDKGAQPPAPR